MVMLASRAAVLRNLIMDRLLCALACSLVEPVGHGPGAGARTGAVLVWRHGEPVVTAQAASAAGTVPGIYPPKATGCRCGR